MNMSFGRCAAGRRRHVDQHERQRGARQPGVGAREGRPATTTSSAPHDHVNLHQSTNDTYPTALKVACPRGARSQTGTGRSSAWSRPSSARSSSSPTSSRSAAPSCRTPCSPPSAARWAPTPRRFGRDRWRIYKCRERLRVVNLGGTAIGTGLGAPRQYIFACVDTCVQITGQGLARAENLVEATQNATSSSRSAGILKACATNLQKIATDLRLLSSGPRGGFGEIHLPPRQAGSSIMPGKVNPVIPEAVTQAADRRRRHDQMILHRGRHGQPRAQPLPAADRRRLLTELDLLTRACDVAARLCVDGLDRRSRALPPARRHRHGRRYRARRRDRLRAAEQLASPAGHRGKPIRQVVVERNLLTAEADFDEPSSHPEAVLHALAPRSQIRIEIPRRTWAPALEHLSLEP
jgi:aspartate ammonia-lyase